jgi:hypothetical protein
MNKKFLNSTLIIIAAVGLVTAITLTTKIPESASMLFFGTGLIGVAGIFKRKND